MGHDDKIQKQTAYNEALEKLTSEKNGKLVTYEDVLHHGNEVMKPVFEDYRKLFIDESGPFKNLTIVYGWGCKGIESTCGSSDG
jgi:hypothetical protein